jgi:hypothetical protein
MLIGSTIIIQERDQSLASLIEEIPARERFAVNMQQFNLVHVVNPFTQSEGSYARIQHLTLTAMECAAAFDTRGVRKIAVTKPEDRDVAPASFLCAKHLDRTVLDLGSFKVRRPLPLLFDVLDRGVAYAEADDYVIYTNIDICPLPQFYMAIRDLICLGGLDAISITRRSISDLAEFRDYPALAASEIGSNHPGFDCLIFRASLYPSFLRCNACIGVPLVARALLYNMIASSRRMLIVKNAHLTYHFGDERAWREKSFADYFRHNVGEIEQLMRQLATDASRLAVLQDFCERHPEPQGLARLARHLTPANGRPR